jgi:hypothetical protein
MNVERELQAALRRQAVPQTLRRGVMKKVAAAGSGRRHAFFARAAALFAAVALTGILGVRISEDRAERKRGESARQELLLAMKITAEKTAVVRDAVRN